MTKEQKELRKEIEAITDPAVIAKINNFIEELMAEQESGNKEVSEGENKKPLTLVEECRFIVIKAGNGRPVACFKEYENAKLFIKTGSLNEKEYEIVEADKIKEK